MVLVRVDSCANDIPLVVVAATDFNYHRLNYHVIRIITENKTKKYYPIFKAKACVRFHFHSVDGFLPLMGLFVLRVPFAASILLRDEAKTWTGAHSHLHTARERNLSIDVSYIHQYCVEENINYTHYEWTITI